MAGRPGRSGGHNKLSVEEHLLRGTYNVTRHGPRAAAVTAAAVAGVTPAPVEVLEGLAGRGKAFVEQCWRAYAGWTPSTLVLLHEAGVLIGQLETVRGQRGERGTQRVLLSVLAALRLDAKPSGPGPKGDRFSEFDAPAKQWVLDLATRRRAHPLK